MVLCDNCANLHFIKIDVEVVEAFSHNFFFFLDVSLSFALPLCFCSAASFTDYPIVQWLLLSCCEGKGRN